MKSYHSMEFVLSLLLLVCVAACSDIIGPKTIGSSVVVVDMSAQELTIGVGSSSSLHATARDENGNSVSDRSIVWSSSNSAIATVSENGSVSGVSIGQAQISASVDGVSSVANVNIVQRAVASIDIGPSSPRIVAGTGIQLNAITRDDSGTPLSDRQIFWESSDPSLASIGLDGYVMGHAEGVVTITARSENRNATIGLVVERVAAASVTLSPQSDTIIAGQIIDLMVVVRDANGIPLLDREITWISSSISVASVSSSGRVTANSPGTVSITARHDDIEATAILVIQSRPVRAVIVSPMLATITVGQQQNISVQITDDQGNLLAGRPLSFSSDNPSVAVVSATGTITGISSGSTEITVNSEGRTGSMRVNVLPTPVASVRVSPPSLTIDVGDNVSLNAIALDSAGVELTNRNVVWISGSPSSIEVDSQGNVRAIAPGRTLVFANIDGKVASSIITVNHTRVSNIIVSPQNSAVILGSYIDLTVQAFDANATPINGRSVKWSSNSPDIALVSGTGRVRGIQIGTSVISAEVDGVVSTATITVVPVPAGMVSITLSESDLIVGQTAQASAVIRDVIGNILLDRDISWRSSNPSVASVSATGVITALSGGSTSIVASSEGVSGSIVVTVRQVAHSLEILSQPGSAVSTIAFSQQPVVRIVDQSGVTVTTGPSANAVVTVRRLTGSTILAGTLQAQAINGIATFNDLRFQGPGLGSHTIEFSLDSSTISVVSSPINVIAGPARTIVATSSIAQSAPAGSVVGSTPSVRITDEAGNPISGVSVTFAIAGGSGTTSPATPAVVVSNASGIAALTSWTLGNTPGANQITATASGLSGSPIVFNATSTLGAPARLAIRTQPNGAVSGVPFTTQAVIEIQDQVGNRINGSTNSITATIASGSGQIAGTVSISAVDGVASFTGMQINGFGNHTISFSSAGLSSATSSTISVSQIAASLALSVQPAGAVSGSVFATQPVVRIFDNAGIPITSGTNSTLVISASRASGSAQLGGTASVGAVNGVATFTNLVFSGTGTGNHILEFSSSSPSLSIESEPFIVSAGLPTSMSASTTVNQTATAGSPVASVPTVLVTDANGNPVAGVEIVFTVASGSGTISPLSPATVTTNSNGLASISAWTTSTLVGLNTVTATAAAIPGGSVVFSATGVAGSPSQLVIALQPGDGDSGSPLSVQPVLEIRDSNNNLVLSGSYSVVASLASGTGVLSGTLSVGLTGGIATFSDLVITGDGSHTILFQIASLALTETSASVTISTPVIPDP